MIIFRGDKKKDYNRIQSDVMIKYMFLLIKQTVGKKFTV